MKVVYVCSPYRSPTESGLHANIEAAGRIARDLWQKGFAVICPQLNTAYFGGVVPDTVFLAGDLDILRKCDGMVVAPGPLSKGMEGEIKFAVEHAIPTIFLGEKGSVTILERFVGDLSHLAPLADVVLYLGPSGKQCLTLTEYTSRSYELALWNTRKPFQVENSASTFTYVGKRQVAVVGRSTLTHRKRIYVLKGTISLPGWLYIEVNQKIGPLEDFTRPVV